MARSFLLALLLALVAAVPAAGHGTAGGGYADWYGLGGCREPGLLIPTRWGNVEPLVAASQRDRIVRLGIGPDAQVLLAMTFVGCPYGRVESPLGIFSTDEKIIEVLLGVGLYISPNPEDLPRFQFYTLRSYVNWGPLYEAWNHVGLPVELVPGMTHSVSQSGLLGLGSFSIDVPATDGRLRLTGQMLAPPTPLVPVEAMNAYEGAAGLVRVVHQGGEMVGLTTQATLTAAPGTLGARLLGGTSATASGVFLTNDVSHVHRAILQAGG